MAYTLYTVCRGGRLRRTRMHGSVILGLRGRCPMQDLQVLLTPVESARMLAIGRSKFYEMLRAGVVPSVKIGRSRRVRVDALLEYVDSLLPTVS